VGVEQLGQTEGGGDQHAHTARKQVQQLLHLRSGRLNGGVVDAAEQPAGTRECWVGRVGMPMLPRPLAGGLGSCSGVRVTAEGGD